VSDGVAWSERHVAGPFDFNTAPVAEGGLFVGDYQGLASASGEFVALFARAHADAANRIDVFTSVFRSSATAADVQARRSPRTAPRALRRLP
jgi:hypothetical protein